MSIKLSFNPLFVHALLAVGMVATAQEPAATVDWLEPSPGVPLVDPADGTVKLWETVPQHRLPALPGGDGISGKALLVTPADMLLKGRTPEEAFLDAETEFLKREEQEATAEPVDSFGTYFDQQIASDNDYKVRLLHAIKKAHPDWKPGLVEKKLKQFRDAGQKLKSDARKKVTTSPPPPAEDPSLKERLQHTERALQESQRREASLRAVVRDLIDQLGHEPSPMPPAGISTPPVAGAPGEPNSPADQANLKDADPLSRLYFQAHLCIRDANEFETKGRMAEAFAKLKEARDLFDEVNKSDPAWQPEILEFRRRKTREEMERVRRLEINRREEIKRAGQRDRKNEANPTSTPLPPSQELPLSAPSPVPAAR